MDWIEVGWWKVEQAIGRTWFNGLVWFQGFFFGGGVSIFFTLHSSVYNSIKIYRALQTIPSHKKGEIYKS